MPTVHWYYRGMPYARFSPDKISIFSRFKRWQKLTFHHADAWITTLAIAITALYLHGRLTLGNLPLAMAITAGYWAAFALNDYFDVDIDRHDPRKREKNVFVKAPDRAKILGGVLLTALVIIGPIFLRYGWPALGVGIISAGVMWAYSAPPLRLKIRPFFDLLAHALFVQTFPYVIVVFLLKEPWLPIDGVLIGLGLLASTTAQLEQQIRDAAHDALIGQTTTLAMGPHRALVLLKLLTAFMIAYGIYFVLIGVIPSAIAPVGFISIPAVIPRFWRQVNQPRPEKLIKLLLIAGGLYIVALTLFQLSVT